MANKCYVCPARRAVDEVDCVTAPRYRLDSGWSPEIGMDAITEIMGSVLSLVEEWLLVRFRLGTRVTELKFRVFIKRYSGNFTSFYCVSNTPDIDVP